MNRRDAFENNLITAIEKEGFEYRITCYGIEFKTSMDTWVVDVRDAHDEANAIVKLFHKDPIAKPHHKGRKCGIPGYHLQFSKKMSVENIIDYSYNHIKKYQKKIAL